MSHQESKSHQNHHDNTDSTHHHEKCDHQGNHEGHHAHKKGDNKTIVLLEVKLTEQVDNIDDFAKRLFEITKHGIDWTREYKMSEDKGIAKIYITVTIEEDKITVDYLVDHIKKAFPNEIDTVDVSSTSKC